MPAPSLVRASVPGRVDPADVKLWAQKWRWYERNSLPWNRARIHAELARRRAFCRWPVHGNVLEMLREGRLELGEHVLLEPGVWLTAPAPGRIRIGGGTFLNLGVQVAAVELVEIGEHCMLANGCFVTDGNHRFDDPDRPVPWQGFTTKGPTRIGDNVWCGANVVITSGVTVGERCVIGANSVVTRDLPPFSIAAGAPAAVLKTIEYERPPSMPKSRLSCRRAHCRQGDLASYGCAGLLLDHRLHAEHDAHGEQQRTRATASARRPPRRRVARPARVAGARAAEDHEREQRA